MPDTIPESQVTPTPVGSVESQPRKSRFVDESELVTIDLGNGDWIKIPARFSFGFSQQFSRVPGEDERVYVSKVASKVIKEWNLVDEQGKIADITVETINRLELSDLYKVVNKAKALIDNVTIPKVG